jgi:competence protein ComEC
MLPLIAGLSAGKALPITAVRGELAAGTFAALAAIFVATRAPRWWALSVAAAMFFAGMAMYAVQRARLAAWEDLPPREARLALKINRLFPPADAKKVTGLGTIARVDRHLSDLAGQQVYFSLALRKGDPAPVRTATLLTVGLLTRLPRDPPVATFDGYLAGAGVNFKLTRGRVLAEEKPALGY